MKIRISLLIVVLMMAHLHTAFALKTDGRDCSGTFPTSIFSSKNKHIIERFEWTDTHTLNPRIVSVEFEEATIEGKIKAYQKTIGFGSVGVSPEGSVSGHDFSLTLDKEFAIESVGLIIPFEKVRMFTKNSGTNDDPGTYTLTGSADFVAVGGGGGITIITAGFGGGYTLSGPIKFETTKSAAPVTYTLTVKRSILKRMNVHTRIARLHCRINTTIV